MRKLLFIAAIVLTAPVLHVGPSQAEGPAVAIVAGTGERTVPRVLVQRLELGLSADGDIRLIDHEFIRRILAEQTLSMSGIAQTDTAIRLGSLLKAGLILHLERVPHDERDIYQVRIMDTDSGIILSSRLLSEHLKPTDIADVLNRMKQARTKAALEDNDLRYVGILQIRSEEPGTSLDGFSKLLEAYLTTALASSQEVIVLDREQLRHLQREADLTASELALRSSAILIEGGVKYTDGRSRISIDVNFRRFGGTAPPPVSMEITDDPDRYPVRLNEVAVRIREQLKVSPPTGTGTDVAREAELFKEQIPLLLAGGRFDEAVNKAEVALALQPGQESRYWAARAWYSLALSLRQEDERLLKPRVTRVTRSDDRMMRRGADDRMMRQPEEQPDPAEEATKRRQAHRLLGAYIRSFSLVRDLTRWHVADPAQIEIPDPLAGLQRYDPNAEMRRETPLYYVVDAQKDTYAGDLLQEIRDISRDYLERQRDYYAEIYAGDPAAAAEYWETWLYAKANLMDFHSFDRKALANFAADVFSGFERFAADGLERRLTGIRPLIQFKPGQNASPDEVALYEDRRNSDDAWTRLLANRLLIRTEFLTYSQNVMRIFHDEIQPRGRLWELEDAGLVPYYLRTAIHRLAVSDPQSLIALFKPTHEDLVKPDHLRHLLAWNAHDCFWPYLNALERGGRRDRVLEEVRRLVRMLDNELLTLTFDEQREANILRLQLDIKLVQLGEQESVTPRLLTYDMYVGETEHRRLRPEIEAPVLYGPVDVSHFTDWTTTAMVGEGRRTSTRSTSRSVGTKDGAWGNASYEGEVHELDVEGNEIVKLFVQSVESEKAKTATPASRAWQEYTVRRLPVRMASTGREWRLQDHIDGPRDLLVPSHTIDGDQIFVAQEQRLEKETLIAAYRHDQQDGTGIIRIGGIRLPGESARNFAITDTAVDEENYYVGTVNGLAVFHRNAGTLVDERDRAAAVTGRSAPRVSRRTGDFEPEPLATTGTSRLITEKNGLPGNQILSLAADGGKLYIGIGPAGTVAGDCGLAVYRPAKNSFEVLSSSRSRAARNPFDGEEFYQIDRMLTAADGSALWLAVNGNPKLNGLWRMDTATADFTHYVQETLPVIDMHWAGGRILYGILGSGIALYDPAADRKSWLLGYIPSKFTGNEPPQPPAGISGAPEYGYAKTQLWPFAMSGDDLFTFGWQAEDVLLHRRGQAAIPKSIFNPDAGVVTGKSYLRSTSEGVLLVQQDGGAFLLVPNSIGRSNSNVRNLRRPDDRSGITSIPSNQTYVRATAETKNHD